MMRGGGVRDGIAYGGEAVCLLPFLLSFLGRRWVVICTCTNKKADGRCTILHCTALRERFSHILLALFVLGGAGLEEGGKGGNDIDARNSLHFGIFKDWWRCCTPAYASGTTLLRSLSDRLHIGSNDRIVIYLALIQQFQHPS